MAKFDSSIAAGYHDPDDPTNQAAVIDPVVDVLDVRY